MGFLSALRQLLGDQPRTDDEIRRRLAAAWGVDQSLADAPESEHGATPGPSSYDRKLWIKKLRHLLTDKLPIEPQQWQDFLADAYALGFERHWVEKQQHAAFELLVRKAVGDGVFSAEEHDQIELARAQIGMTDGQAQSVVERVVAEAEDFFGRSIQEA